MSEKSNSMLRKIVLFSLIISFTILSTIFINQYLEYKKVEQRLNSAYATKNILSPGLYHLFSTFGEADNLFRLYTVSFDKEDFKSYQNKLDTVKAIVDSLAALPIHENPLKESRNKIPENHLALKYASLKKQIDHIVYYAEDSLKSFINAPAISYQQPRITSQDSIASKILRDHVQQTQQQDTLVKKKENLFNRIFYAKNDTLINERTNEVLNVKQTNTLQRNIENLISTNEVIYKKNISNLRAVLQKLRVTEKSLILSNYTLLNNLKTGIDQLRQIELEEIRKAEENDFALYKENSKIFGQQLIIALFIMLIMILLLAYYQYKVYSYSKKLTEEKDYASKIATQKSNMLANISHEVRAPLVTLQGLVNLLKTDNDSKSIDKEIIQTIDHDINVVNSTLNDILNLSKMEAGKLDLKCSYISIYKIIEDVVALHQYQAEIKTLKLINNNTISPDFLVLGNAFRYKQIISNLLSNAIKYTDKGTVQIDALIKKSADKEKLTIRISDTGIGIENIHKDQIFRKYYVADNKNKNGSFGLGLYIAKTLAEQINGSLEFTSEVGKGAVFTFEVEIKKSQINDIVEHKKSIIDLPDDLKIVFIDDSKIGLYYIQQLFKDNKNVHLFNDGKQALDFISSTKVDIVITDLNMPGIKGWGILENIKSNYTTSSTKVLVCTAEAMLIEEKDNPRLYSFDDVINKPINEEDLVSSILKVNTNRQSTT